MNTSNPTPTTGRAASPVSSPSSRTLAHPPPSPSLSPSSPSASYRAPQRPQHLRPPNFTVQLRPSLPNTPNFDRSQVVQLVDRVRPAPGRKTLRPAQFIAAEMGYQRWRDALAAVVFLWEERLRGSHLYNPCVMSQACDKEELRGAMRGVFERHVRGLMEGEAVGRWRRRIEGLSAEIEWVDKTLSRRGGVRLAELDGFQRRRKGLVEEREMAWRRVEEFGMAMKCILAHIDGSRYNGQVELNVIRLPSELDWNAIHFVIMRECRRLDDGLPIYCCRHEILQIMQSRQVMVLIGETGSGKSTQLVQFLADSRLPGCAGSVTCTQPRKIAAISLMQRVQEESNGCYKDSSVICYPFFSSSQEFKSKVIFMTDHCLLQHYMNDNTLTGISCIIVDEAHERSLNTDLLLALLKGLLLKRPDLQLIITSATADAQRLSDYFFGCATYRVVGRNYPVEIKYVPSAHRDPDTIWRQNFGNCPSYVSDVVKTVHEIIRTEKKGTVLAFLTSPTEVEWACENFKAPSVVALPLHGKLSPEEQRKVFIQYGERKVIFATNIAETSLTIPGVKYVVDSGMVKESRFDPTTGMNVLHVDRISQSSATQRAGRAGRTEPGKCYRLYSEEEFLTMPSHQEPEICRVHLGIAILKIIALGIKNVQDFDFVDAPTLEAINRAIDNLFKLGAVRCKNNTFQLTEAGRYLLKLGIEPRLGKLILESLHYHLCKEGIVLAALMAHSSSIFYRVGNSEDKLKSDSLKVPFCHQDGDLFTLLSVYKEWEKVPAASQSKWCVNNKLNAKSMRRCKDAVQELENCLKNEVKTIVPKYWRWNPDEPSEQDKNLKKVIFSSLAENLAVYSGYDRCGYQVASTKHYVQLHPSCSLLIYSQRPSYVVFGDVLSISSQYLVCVTAVDIDYLCTLSPSPVDVLEIEKQKLLLTVMKGFGTVLLKKFCGRANSCISALVSCIRYVCQDERIGVQVDVDKNEIQVFASSKDMEKVTTAVNDALEYEAMWLRNECIEKCLYHVGPGNTPSSALIGAGGEIRHLELEKKYLTVEVFHSDVRAVDDKELLKMFEKNVSGIASFHRHPGNGQEGEGSEKWGKITFLTPAAAERAVAEMNDIQFSGSLLRVCPSWFNSRADRYFTFPAVRARVCWPRRHSKGHALVKCASEDFNALIRDFSSLEIQGRRISCEISQNGDRVAIYRVDKELSEPDLLNILRANTDRKIFGLHLLRGDPVYPPLCASCEEAQKALAREISPFVTGKHPLGHNFHVQVFPPEPDDYMMKAVISFDGRLYLEAAMALEHIKGKVLPGCLSWQKIDCQRIFYSSVFCPGPVYPLVKQQLDALFQSFKDQNGCSYTLERNENGSYRVKISANATKTVADMRKPLEKILQGKKVTHGNLTPTILKHLFSRDGISLMKSVQQETGTYILFDRKNLSVRIFGSQEKLGTAEFRLVRALLILNENKQLEIQLRGKDLPHDLMKEVVKKFGPDLHGLKEKLPDTEVMLNIRRHAVMFRGDKESKQKMEEIIYDFARSLSDNGVSDVVPEGELLCPICLCEVEDRYKLEACCHSFCRLCLVEQCDSAIKSQGGFPLCCTHEGCGKPILIADLRDLLMPEKLDDLFRASLSAFVVSSGGTYRFCPSPDCPGVYRVSQPGEPAVPFSCGACHIETCTSCHLEYHPDITCDRYKDFKDDPDSSLKEWCKGKEQVKCCPVCGYTIEKVDGCNHIECKCGNHICWACLDSFSASEDCYDHLRTTHHAII